MCVSRVILHRLAPCAPLRNLCETGVKYCSHMGRENSHPLESQAHPAVGMPFQQAKTALLHARSMFFYISCMCLALSCDLASLGQAKSGH